MGMNETVFYYQVDLCDCYGDLRGTDTVPYERDREGRVVCAECGNTPIEVPIKIPLEHYVELEIHQEIEGFTRRYHQVLPPGRNHE